MSAAHLEENEAVQSGAKLLLRVFPGIMLPMFLAVVDQTIVATALPTIGADLGNVERLSWVVVSYLIANTIAAAVYGRLGDAFGRRRLMVVALVMFIGASVLCALSRSVEMLSCMRVLQGLGGGGLMTLSQALIGEVVPGRERGRYQGYFSTIGLTAGSFGPVVGGYLTEHFGWQSIFLVNLPVGLIALVLTMRLPGRPGSGDNPRFDWTGLTFFTLVVAPILLALEELRGFNLHTLPLVFGLVIASVICSFLLYRVENMAAEPLLPFTLLRHPSIWRCSALAACHGAAIVSLITYLPIYFRVARGTEAAETGLLMLPLTVMTPIGSIIAGRLISRTGHTAIFPSIGMMGTTVVLVLVAVLAPSLSTVQFACLVGMAGFFMPSAMTVVQITVQTVGGPTKLGAMSASVQISRSVGAAIGTTVVGVILFTILTLTDAANVALFQQLVQEGPAAMANMSAASRELIQEEVAGAFRTAFMVMAAFTSVSVLMAWTMPLRRVS